MNTNIMNTKRSHFSICWIIVLAILVFKPVALLADAPVLLVSVKHDPDVGALAISGGIEWNRRDLYTNDKKRAEIRKRGIFCGAAEGEKVITSYKLGGRELRLEMVFPKKESGRKLNESTRVELSIYEKDSLILKTKYFGQHSDRFTQMPASGIKLRGNSIRLSLLQDKPKDLLTLVIRGELGKNDRATDGGLSVGITKGFSLKFKVPDGGGGIPITDEKISQLLGKSTVLVQKL